MFGDLSPFGDSVIFAHQNISTDPSLRNFWLWHSEAAMHIIGKELYQEQQLHIRCAKIESGFSTAINDNQVEKMTHFHQWQLVSSRLKVNRVSCKAAGGR